MKDRIVVLNSGGFDSVVLMNYLHFIQEEDNIYSLHFLYGAIKGKKKVKFIYKFCEKFGAVNKQITIPRFNWTQGDFYKKCYNFDTQYIEYRNLVFLSYAVSYAQSIGSRRIYVAFLDMVDYDDANLEFLRGLNLSLERSGIQIDAPFIFDNKTRLGHIAKYLGITESDYFSCDNPDDFGNPCGVCADCKALYEIKQKVDKI